MKLIPLLLAALIFALCGCASTEPAAQKQPDKIPEVGMTKDQVIALYGKTDNKNMTSEGETWVYNLNMGEAFIPFNFGYRPKTRMIYFDKEGKVARWSSAN
jgi:hypothetical protein